MDPVILSILETSRQRHPEASSAATNNNSLFPSFVLKVIFYIIFTYQQFYANFYLLIIFEEFLDLFLKYYVVDFVEDGHFRLNVRMRMQGGAGIVGIC